MTRWLPWAGLALAATGVLGGAAAVTARTLSSTDSGVAIATVVAPITIIELADLDFGLITGGDGGDGTATIAPFAATVAFAGSARSGCASSDRCVLSHAARFAVSGEPARGYTVSLPAALTIAPESAAQQAGGALLRVTGFTVRAEGQLGTGGQGRLDSSGQGHFEVGATLLVPSGTASGRYRTSLPIMVTYG